MRGWLAANLFLLGMAICAASILFAGTYLIRSLHFDESSERTLIGYTALSAIIATGLIFRALLRRIERRR